LFLQVGDSSLRVGAVVSLSALIGLLQENQSKSTSFELLANHLSKIANVPVRNIGSWAGNLMLTHDHDNFPSDVFTMMAGVGAKVTIGKLLSLFSLVSSTFKCCT
jgi:xanthine dehydrogenase/oxidase